MAIEGKITNILGFETESILIIEDIVIQNLLSIEKYNYKAIICKRSTYFSHAEIFLENISIPVIFLKYEDFIKIRTGENIKIDLLQKKVFMNDDIFNFTTALNINKSNRIESTENIIKTNDDIEIKLELGLRNPNNIDIIRNSKIDSVSIIHTETIEFRKGNYNEQLSKYKSICEKLYDRKMSFRLFDFGGDKLFDWVPVNHKEIASFGLRGYRLYKWKEIEELIKNQIACFDVLSKNYKIDLIIPYISSFRDYEDAQQLVYDYTQKSNLDVIPMLETVSAFFEISEISQKSQKMIIGTNDLLQSFFSANRNLSVNSNFLNPYNVGFVRFLNLIKQQSNSFTICGNLTLLDYYLSILIGIGFRSFIVPAQFFDSISDKIKNINSVESESLAMKIMNSRNDDIIEILKNAAPNNL